jgi:hypothetical protein
MQVIEKWPLLAQGVEVTIDGDNNGTEILVAIRRAVKYAGFVNE